MADKALYSDSVHQRMLDQGAAALANDEWAPMTKDELAERKAREDAYQRKMTVKIRAACDMIGNPRNA